MTNLRHRLLPRSLFGRSLLIIAMPIIILQIVVAFIFFDRHWTTMSEKLVFALASEVKLLSSDLAAARTPQEVQQVTDKAARSLELHLTLQDQPDGIVQAQGSRLGRFYWFSTGRRLERMLEQKLDVPFAVKPYDREKWFMVEVEITPGRVAHFLFHERRLVSSTTYIFFIWVIGSAFILFAISILFMRNQIRPILKLAVAAEKFGKGQDVPDFRPIGSTEIRQAAKSFIQMKERLKRQLEQRASMLAGVSHDLRTPLTRMRLQLALSPESDEIANLRQDIDEMEKMVEGYLTFAKGEGDEPPALTDMTAILHRIAANARRQGHDVQLSVAERLNCRLRPLAVERALTNIVNNACKFAQHVWLAAHDDGTTLEIIVDDDGPGIAPEQHDEVFKPFYRIEKSRNKKTGGVGLGLSITQDIVHAHGGEIFLEDSNRGGLRVVVRLPL